jgi:hypothetical protein
MGIYVRTPTLWHGLYNLVHSKTDMDFFLATQDEEGRMELIQMLGQKTAPVDN